MICAIVLVKGFDGAKQRLSAALSPEQRRRLAEEGAVLAIAAAAEADRVIVVAGSAAAAAVAAARGAEVVLEAQPAGQNVAAGLGIARALELGATAIALLSSDLPLVTPEAFAAFLDHARALTPPAVLAAPATGRGGTNALFITPPDAIELHFGDDSLNRFESESAERGAAFVLHDSPELALDLDEPDDLARLPHTLAG